jgi:type IV pilus assembly protein PilZ
VDCVTDDTFLYAAITNISEMGIFVRCNEPFLVGTLVSLRFAPNDGHDPFVLPGRVQWVNPYRPECRNPGMGVRFLELTGEDRERLVEVIHTIAYVRDPSN